MIEFLTALFHAMQHGYAAVSAMYYAGPIIRDAGLMLSIVFLGVMFIRGRGR